ncbi:MAG TPA: hypothetical protein VG916_00285 [Gemmatimonadaceae bacterium]|nr:hypothetical protein [Gemmatimonadaceae bacterium]
MPTRTININGTAWRVQPSGYVTQYDADEFGVLFVHVTPAGRELRVARYRPAVRARDHSLAELSDARLRELFAYSQPSDTSPEGGYSR